MTTANRGDIGVIKIMENLIQQSIAIFIPFSASLPFDIVAYTNNKFYKIQVKYRKLGTNKKILAIYADRSAICNSHITRKNYTDDDFDVLAVYCPDTNQCYFIPKNTFNTRCIHLRLTAPENKQHAGIIRYAKDFTVFNNCLI
jgi:hypothetical protein